MFYIYIYIYVCVWYVAPSKTNMSHPKGPQKERILFQPSFFKDYVHFVGLYMTYITYIYDKSHDGKRATHLPNLKLMLDFPKSMLDIWWRYLKTRKQKPWGNMQGHKACNQQPSHESNKETPTLPPSHLFTKSIQVSFSFTIWPQCASKVVPPARSPQKVISKTSFIFLKCSGSQFSGDFGFKFASFFFGFSGARGGTQRFPWNFRVF